MSGYAAALEQAAKLIKVDREAEYGNCRQNHDRIARYWSTFLGINLCANDVAIMLALVKISRLSANYSHKDNYVDGAAYLSIAHEFNRQDCSAESSVTPVPVTDRVSSTF